ncbi:DUF305 domain-containing protein [Candidatus Saccharibacteria bacterium]|nr:DUF305 domain-containing protein [Candidatus Saccharibacteria bacterium]
MVPKALLGGVIGFILGGLVVSSAYYLGDDQSERNSKSPSTSQHNEEVLNELKALKGDNFDKAFLKEMIAHHEGAIEMAKLTQTNAKHDELKKLGQEIMSAQSMEIDMMQTWQGDFGYKDVPKSHDVHIMQ